MDETEVEGVANFGPSNAYSYVDDGGVQWALGATFVDSVETVEQWSPDFIGADVPEAVVDWEFLLPGWHLVSITPAIGTMDWDPAAPVVVVLDLFNAGTVDLSTLTYRRADGVSIISAGVIQAGWTGSSSVVLSNGDTRLTITLLPDGGWPPFGNYTTSHPLSSPYDAWTNRTTLRPWQIEVENDTGSQVLDTTTDLPEAHFAFSTSQPIGVLAITTTSLPDGIEDTPYTQNIDATSTAATGDFSWSVVAGALPAGLALAASTAARVVLTGTPTTPGAYSFTIQVADGVGTDTQAYTILVPGATLTSSTPASGELNHPPATPITAVLTVAGATWNLSTLDISADTLYGDDIIVNGVVQAGWSDASTAVLSAGNTVLTLSLIPNADWLPLTNHNNFGVAAPRDTWDSVTLSAITIDDSLGNTYSIDVWDFTTTSQSGTLDITTDFAPYMQPAAFARAIYAAGDQPFGSYTWSVVSGAIPAECSLTQDTSARAAITGEPSEGVYTFTLRVADGVTTDDRAYTVTIVDPDVDAIWEPPVGSTIAPGDSILFRGYSTGEAVPDNLVGYYTFAGPSFAAISDAIGPDEPGPDDTENIYEDEVVGADFTVDVVSYPEMLQVTFSRDAGWDAVERIIQSNGTVSAGEMLTVNINGTPVSITWGAAAAFTTRAAALVTAINATVSGVTAYYAEADGADALIVLMGTVTSLTHSDYRLVAPYARVRVNSGEFEEVYESPGNYWLVEAPVDPIVITTLSLASGTVDVAYAQDISAVGGTNANYVWSVVSGQLPPGLTLAASGTPTTTLTGTPTTAGIYTFTVRVEDDDANADTQIYTVTIVNPQNVTVRFIPQGAADINGGVPLTLVSSLGAYHSMEAQMLTPSAYAAPSDWVLDSAWRYVRLRGLFGSALSDGSTITNTAEVRTANSGLVNAGEVQVDIAEWSSTDVDGDFGVEWRTGTASVRLVLRGLSASSGVAVLETDNAGLRTVVGSVSVPAGYPSRSNLIQLRLIYAGSVVYGFVNEAPVAAGVVFPASTPDSELHLVARARTDNATCSGNITRVETKAVVLIDGQPAQVTSPTENVRALEILTPRAQRLDRLGRRDVIVAGYFGEVLVRNAFTYLLPRRNLRTRQGIARRE